MWRVDRHERRQSKAVAIVNVAYCQSLVRELERSPSRVPAYYGDLEKAILWLMDATFESEDKDERVLMAATEMRARLVLERWKGHDVN